MKSLSIKDIALKANVSITTVSFIINGKAKEKSISDAVIKKVQQIIVDSGYKPNQIARSLRTGNSNLIGLIVEDISNSFFSRMARLLEDKAYKKGYKIIYSSTENHIGKAQELINLFKSRKVDAYIISPIKGIEEDIQLLLNENKPVIFFDRNLPGLPTSYVGTDHYVATYQAIQSFIKLGKKRIAFVTIAIDVQQISERFDAYKEALANHAFPYDESLMLSIPFNQAETATINQLKQLLSDRSIDAVLFATNYLAVSGLKALKQMGRKPDENLAIIGYDDHEAFELHTPGISAIQQPVEEIADAIINLVLSQLASKAQLPAQQIIIPAQLMVRN